MGNQTDSSLPPGAPWDNETTPPPPGGAPSLIFPFIIGSEILPRFINKEKYLGNISGLKMSKQCPQLSHLLFAYDLILFILSSIQNANSFLSCLDVYSWSWSGQVINKSKGSIHFSHNASSSTIRAVKLRFLISRFLQIESNTWTFPWI